MNRKEYLETSLKLGLCSCAFLFSGASKIVPAQIARSTTDDELEKVKAEKEFIQNWLTDLLDTMSKELDLNTQVKMYEGTGRGCYNRYTFKQDIAADGKGDVDKLLEAYKRNFEVWREGDMVHIRYGERSAQCYCPAAKFKPAKPGDLHCECTRTTHQTIFETALGRPIRIEVLESLRRGGQTCHFLVHL